MHTSSSEIQHLTMGPSKDVAHPKWPMAESSSRLLLSLFYWGNGLVVLDAYSKYPEVEIVSSTATGNTFPALERIFPAHGIPEGLKTDDGSLLQGQAFHEFAMEKSFHHGKITSLWPEANGHAENFMKNLGKVGRTTRSQGKDWRTELYVFVANYRATPHPSTGEKPLQIIHELNSKGQALHPPTS